MIPGLQWIANFGGWERSLKLLLAACVGQLKAASAAENLAAGRRREMTLVSAIALDAMLTGLQGDSQEAWQGRVDEAITLLASGDPTDERWMEIDWRLRFHIAFGHLCWRNCIESANLFAALLPELAQDRFKLWPYTEEAGYFWRAGLYLWWGYDALHLGQHDEARRLAEQCLAIGVQSGIPFLKMPGLILLSSVMLTTGDCPQAERYLREYLRISRAHGLKYLVAVALYHLGLALIGQARYAQAQTCLQRSLAWGKETGQLLSASIQALGTVELAVGNSLQAQRCYEQAVSLNEGAGSSIGLANALTGLARALIARGNLGMARGHLLRSLELLRGVCALEFVIGTIAAMTELLDAEGQMEAAVELCAALLSWPFTPYCTHDTAQRVRPDLATRLQGLAARLPPEIFAAATARGRQRQIDEVVAELIEENG